MVATEIERNLSFEELREIVVPIAERYGVERVYLFGSRARGDNSSESDFDFYIVPGRIQTLTKLCGLLRELEEALEVGVDIISEGSRIKDDFLQEVLRDRRLVYEA